MDSATSVAFSFMTTPVFAV